MDLFSSTKLLESALNGATLKQRAISSNIANGDTPNYKSKEVTFQTELSNALQQQKSLKSYRVHKNHIPFSTENERGFQAKVNTNSNTLFNHNGNNVDMDYEMAQMAKNQIWYNALIDRTNGRFNSLKKVIEGS